MIEKPNCDLEPSTILSLLLEARFDKVFVGVDRDKFDLFFKKRVFGGKGFVIGFETNGIDIEGVKTKPDEPDACTLWLRFGIEERAREGGRLYVNFRVPLANGNIARDLPNQDEFPDLVISNEYPDEWGKLPVLLI